MKTKTYATHTPGPWEYKDNGQINSKDANIAQVYKYAGEIEINEMHANASLIASAPELLLALRKARSRILELHDDHSYGYSCDTLEMIDNAIAKAEGKT